MVTVVEKVLISPLTRTERPKHRNKGFGSLVVKKFSFIKYTEQIVSAANRMLGFIWRNLLNWIFCKFKA